MPDISMDEFKDIPWIDTSNIGGRMVITLSFYVEKEWSNWIPTADGLFKFKGGSAEGVYFADEPENKDDVYMEFMDFLAQKSFWPHLRKPIRGIQDDIFNIFACLRKFEILFEASKIEKHATSRMVLTELEYLFGVCRSIYDLLQEIIAGIWNNNIKFLDNRQSINKLPTCSFRKVVLFDNEIRTTKQIQKKHHLPQPMAEFYSRRAPFFLMLKKYRDNITHRGSSLESVYVTEKGFAVPDNTKPYCDFNVWNDGHKLPNNLASLRPVIGYMVNETFEACEDFAATIQKIIRFPSEISPGLHLYMKSFNNSAIVRSVDALENCLWWDAQHH